MKFIFAVLMAFLLPFLSLNAKPTKVIFDTDVGNDIDDALAMVLLYNYHIQGKIDLIGITLSKGSEHAKVFVDIMNQFYGLPQIPIAEIFAGKLPDNGPYFQATIEATDPDGRYSFARRTTRYSKIEESTQMLRRLLASEKEDNAIVLVVVGYSTNLARLLASAPDTYSDLNGKDLIAKKVKYVSQMAGKFDSNTLKNPNKHKPEWNMQMDAKSAEMFLEHCPVPIIFSGYEVGDAVRISQDGLKEKLYNAPRNPAWVAYEAFVKSINQKTHDRQTWDLTSVLIVAEPDSPYFTLSKNGKATIINDAGCNDFTENKDGLHRYLILDENKKEDLKKRFLELCSLKPANN